MVDTVWRADCLTGRVQDPSAPPNDLRKPHRFPPYSIALLLAVSVPLIAVTTHSPAADVVTRRSILDAVHARASVELAENFGGDLRQWTGHDGWSGSWSIDDAGFGRP